MSKYLYGAAVQGIQGFIFETNKLREIAGGSEFVEKICTTLFKGQFGLEEDKEHPGKIIGAAGNIRYILDEQECKHVVRFFSKSIIEQAPGIVITQAAVRLEQGYPSGDDFKLLEERLEAQRNLPAPSFLPSWMAVERSRRTGIGAQEADKDVDGNNVYPSRQEALKRDESKKAKRLLVAITGEKAIDAEVFPKDIDKIVGKEKDNRDKWIAVMHADGNGLGQLILNLMTGPQRKEGKELLEVYRDFSQKLDFATKAAAQIAFKSVFRDLSKFSTDNPVPIRPILLGGDDITIIIKADKALEFTRIFMKEFEAQTKTRFATIDWPPLKNGLTIKAGIAYVKPSYPFHFAVNLAEDLCKKAKEDAKRFMQGERIPSSLMFHKVHSSFTGDYNEMIERETAANRTHRFDFGPYFLESKEGYASIAELEAWIYIFQQEDAPTAQIRSLITEYADGKLERAKQYEERIRSLNRYDERLAEAGMRNSIFWKRKDKTVSPALDIINMTKLHYKHDKQEA